MIRSTQFLPDDLLIEILSISTWFLFIFFSALLSTIKWKVFNTIKQATWMAGWIPDGKKIFYQYRYSFYVFQLVVFPHFFLFNNLKLFTVSYLNITKYIYLFWACDHFWLNKDVWKRLKKPIVEAKKKTTFKLTNKTMTKAKKRKKKKMQTASVSIAVLLFLVGGIVSIFHKKKKIRNDKKILEIKNRISKVKVDCILFLFLLFGCCLSILILAVTI